MIRRLPVLTVLLVGLLVSAVAFQVPPLLRAASVLTSTIGLEDETGLTAWVTEDIQSEEMTLPLAEPLQVIVHRPRHASSNHQGILLVHGIHPEGMRERRFQRFARSMAAVGNVVMTPSLPELASLEATPHSVERIQAAAAALAQRVQHPILAIGISVGGGLTLMAAAAQQGTSPIGQVAAIGAHHDLVRVARHYAGVPATDTEGHASDLKPHHYGIQVLARAHAARLFDAEDVDTARMILQSYLRQHYDAARAALTQLTPPGQALMQALLSDPHGAVVKQHLLAAITAVESELRQVSPAGRLAGLRVPVLLLHGATDPVIPPTELSWLAHEVPTELLRAQLVTPVLTHTEFPEDAKAADFVGILAFVAQLLPPL